MKKIALLPVLSLFTCCSINDNKIPPGADPINVPIGVIEFSNVWGEDYRVESFFDKKGNGMLSFLTNFKDKKYMNNLDSLRTLAHERHDILETMVVNRVRNCYGALYEYRYIDTLKKDTLRYGFGDVFIPRRLLSLKWRTRLFFDYMHITADTVIIDTEKGIAECKLQLGFGMFTTDSLHKLSQQVTPFMHKVVMGDTARFIRNYRYKYYYSIAAEQTIDLPVSHLAEYYKP